MKKIIISKLQFQNRNVTPLKNIALKTIHIISSLLLQKPSKSSKAREHFNELEKLIKLWEEGNINGLLAERRTKRRKTAIKY